MNRARHTRKYVAMAVAMLVWAGAPAEESRADFLLWEDQQLTLYDSHLSGTLYDRSGVEIMTGGDVRILRAYHQSSVHLDVGSVGYLYAYDTSAVRITTGSLRWLYAHDGSTVHINSGSSGGVDAYGSSAVRIAGGTHSSVFAHESSSLEISGGDFTEYKYVSAYDSATLNVSGGTFPWVLYGHGSSIVNITGGGFRFVKANDSSVVSISNGTIASLRAYGTSTVRLIARKFRLGDGLWIDGARLYGGGLLSGEWSGGERWSVDIQIDNPGPTVLAMLIGDVDLSGYVDDDDLSLVLANWGTETEWTDGDLDSSGLVDDDDLSLLLANWGAGPAPAPEAIPEPATLSLLAIGGLALLRRKGFAGQAVLRRRSR
ncbi:hypothetical protein LCGC14_2616250 [marine sediment metagenome]|uniref:Ice-binding protein C-terminal domain-containing protein n=1 Tax=marine sediment metagenome TaxID=412755 RepID=A0A0F9A4C6_9ZZZZ